MSGFDEAVAAIMHRLRHHVDGINAEALTQDLIHHGHAESMIRLALSSLTAGGSVDLRGVTLHLGHVDRSLPSPPT